MRINLTTVALKQFPFVEKGQLKIRDAQLPGFGVIIGKRSKTFFVMSGTDRKTQTIGKFPDISLAEARKLAMGKLGDNRTQFRPPTLSEAREQYLMECEKKNRPATVASYSHLLSFIDDKPLDRIRYSDLEDPTSHQVMAWRVFFNWCVRQKFISENPFLGSSVKYGRRDRVLTDEEIKSIWYYQREPYSTMLQLLLLTGQRRNQIWGLKPEWVSDDLVIFPADVMKSKRSHTIPLGKAALALTGSAPFTFNGWSKGKRRIDRVTGVSDWTVHDLRRTFATIHARIGTPIHVTEAYLDHSSGTISGVTAIYVRHDFMKEMAEAILRYEDFIFTLVSP